MSSEPATGIPTAINPSAVPTPATRLAPRRHEQRGGQGCAPAHDRRAEQLEAARLLLGARVPDDEEQGEDRDRDRAHHAHLEGGERADGRLVVDGAVQREGGRRAVDGGGGLQA